MKLWFAACLIGSLAACSGETAAPEATRTGESPLTASEPAQPAAIASPTDADQAKQIPVALQGRWGLVPGDCTSTRGDAKGLLTVSASALRHYESVGKLRSVSSATTNSISGTFAYTGEGMNWTRDVTLSVQGNGNSLDFRDSGADSPPSDRTYARCQ